MEFRWGGQRGKVGTTYANGCMKFSLLNNYLFKFIEDLHKESEIPEVLPLKDSEQIRKERKKEICTDKTLEQLITGF